MESPLPLFGSTARVSGTRQRELKYAYDVSEGRMRTTVRLADDSILTQTLENGFGETVVEAEASTTGFIYTRSEYNNRGQLARSYKDTGAGTTPTATRKKLISNHFSTLAEKSVAIDERGLTSTEWTEYGVGTVKDSYSSVPTSSITAHCVMVGGFTVSQSDHAGVASTQSRRFTETGLELTRTDGRGNATTTCTDIAGCTVFPCEFQCYTATTFSSNISNISEKA